MKKKFKLGVIGAGFMASAIVKGAIKSNKLLPCEIIVSDVNQCALDNMAKLGVSITTDNVLLADQAEFVLFAIKPQSLNDVLSSIKNTCCDKFISIMAGVKKQKIKDYFPTAKVARCMPNTPCAIGCGAVGLDVSDFEIELDVLFIKDLLNSFASVAIVEENDLNVVTGISGSSPAYFYLFLKGIIECGVKNGLSYEVSKQLATNTMIGAGRMVLEHSEKTLDELITAVCSKGGTTIEAVNVYNEHDLSSITDQAIQACIIRAEELEKL